MFTWTRPGVGNQKIIEKLPVETVESIRSLAPLEQKVEAFKEKYIKVDIVDEADHVFELRWIGFMYEGKFLDMTMTCQYKVEKDFSAVKTTHGTDLQAPVVIRKKSGRPVSMQS